MKKQTKKSKLPLISIVIPTYASQRTIEKCLLSLKEQTYPHIEIIVVDSPFYPKKLQKKCKRIIEKYARYIVDGPERSIQRNRGMKEAKGEYIATIDQDMYLSKDVIADCYKELVRGKYIALTIPEISIGQGYWTECVALDRYITTVLEKGANECCRFFKKTDGLQVGGYNVDIVGAEDAEFHHKMELKGKIGKINEVIYHDEGKTDFWKRVKKKYYYSKAFRGFIKKYPQSASKSYFPLKKAYFDHWELLAKKPFVTIGIIILRTSEVTAGVLGLLFS